MIFSSRLFVYARPASLAHPQARAEALLPSYTALRFGVAGPNTETQTRGRLPKSLLERVTLSRVFEGPSLAGSEASVFWKRFAHFNPKLEGDDLHEHLEGDDMHEHEVE